MCNWRMKTRWLAILVGFLVTGACSLPALAPSAGEPNKGELEAGAIELEGTDLELPELLPASLLSSLKSDVAVAEPGEVVTFSADIGISGWLTLKSPTGEVLEAAFDKGKASLVIPQNATGGVYTATVTSESDALAIGRVRIAHEPGIWLTTDRRYVSTNDQALLRVFVHGIPLDTPALLMVGDVEDEPSMLIPSSGGILVLSYTPVPLREFIDRPLVLPGFLADQVSILLVQEPEGTVSLQSNTVQLVACDQRGAIRGDLGGKGIIRVVSFSGGVTTSTAWTQDGEFTIYVPPGQGALFGWLQPDEGPSTQVGPVWVDVPCGRELEIGMSASTARMAALRPSGWSSHAKTAVRALARPVLNAAARQQGPAAAPLASASGEEPCRKVVVYSSVEGGDSLGNVINLAPELAGQLGSNLSEAEVITSAELWQAFEHQDAGEDDQDRDTRTGNAADYASGDHFIVYGDKGFLSGGGTYIVLLYGLPKAATDAKVVVRDTFQGSGIERRDLLAEVGRAFRGLFGEFTQKMKDAAICGKVEPVEADLDPGEATAPQLVYTLTNLAGEEVQGAEVDVKGAEIGKINPEEGRLSGTEFTATYTAAKDSTQYDELLAFEATAGNVRTKEGESTVAISVGGNYRIQASLSFDSDSGYAFVLANYNLEATSCETGRRGPFKGSLQMSGVSIITGGVPVDISEQFEFVLPEGGGPFQSGLEHLEIKTFYMPGLNDVPGTVLFMVDGHPLLMGVIEKIPPEVACP